MGTVKRYRPWGRVTFIQPGKHGDRDVRVELGTVAPTLAETLTVIWGHFKAEDRYDAEHHEGRAMFKRLIDSVYAANTWAEARQVVEACDKSIKTPTATPTISPQAVFSTADEEMFDRFWKESAKT